MRIVVAHATSFYEAARREIGLLVATLTLAVATLVFVSIADEVREGQAISFDRSIMLALRDAADLSNPVGPPWFEEMARDVTALGSFAVLLLITFATVLYLVMERKRRAALLVLAAVGGGTLLSTVLKMLFARARPDLVPHATEVFTASFPSGHAMMSAVTYLTLGALLARVQPNRAVKVYLIALAAAVTALVGASRVYLGVHWPTDVLAGWCVGASWAILCWLAARALQTRGQVERSAATPGAGRP